MRIDDIISLGHALEKIQNTAFDLWTTLPSAEAARQQHGDYYSEHQPSIDQIIVEAGYALHRAKNPDWPMGAEEWSYYQCPCGEHDTEKPK